MRERVSLTGTLHSMMSSSHRNIRFGRMSIIQRVHLAPRWVFLPLYLWKTLRLVLPSVLAAIFPMAFGTQIRVTGEKRRGRGTFRDCELHFRQR